MTKVTRNLHQNLHSNKNRTNSSGLWLSRNINDPYVLKARKDGYRSRAAYKLVEIDDKMHLIGKSHSILDLGAAPGSWSQVLRARAPKVARIVALDILEMEYIEGVEFISFDITLGSELLLQAVHSADLIVSDIAPNFCGIPEADHLQSIELCEEVLDLLPSLMRHGGAFIMKVFQGVEEPALFHRTKAMFSAIKRIKPSSSRKESGELYYCATGFLGQGRKVS